MEDGRSSKHALRWQAGSGAGPDGLAALRADVCARQTVVGETAIRTQRLLECLEKEEEENNNKQKERNPRITARKAIKLVYLCVWRRTEEEDPHPAHTPSPTRPVFSIHHFVPSLWSELPSHHSWGNHDHPKEPPPHTLDQRCH